MLNCFKVFDTAERNRRRLTSTTDRQVIVLILYALRSVASINHIWSTIRLCAPFKQARFILKFNFRRFGMNLLVNNSKKKAEIVPIVADLYNILIGKS